MKCPKCEAEMEAVRIEDIEVNRCVSCQGLWFDMLEDETLRPIAAKVDIGKSATGAKYNLVDRINCPVCANTQLLRMVDPQQSHIWFESCPSCYGRFFDAGEFKDLGTRSIIDLIRDMFTKERR